MNKKVLVCGVILLGLFMPLSSVGAGSPRPSFLATPKSLILYDAVSGAVPNSSLMSFADFPFGEISPAYSEQATILDTTVKGNESLAGWVSSAATTLGFPMLDPADGVQVNFMVQVESESHTRDTRSGLSLIVLSKEKRGIELSFGENEIWAKSDDNTGGLFTRGEDAAFGTTKMTAYQLIFAGETYTLTANGQPILSGPLRDYTPFDGFPDPYETPNFLFIGDNTTSAQVRIRLQFLSIIGSEPVTLTNTSEPSATIQTTPVPQTEPTAISTPLPTPPQSVIVLCPSGWIIAGAAGFVMSIKVRRGV
jgi:hypothetical protein